MLLFFASEATATATGRPRRRAHPMDAGGKTRSALKDT